MRVYISKDFDTWFESFPMEVLVIRILLNLKIRIRNLNTFSNNFLNSNHLITAIFTQNSDKFLK